MIAQQLPSPTYAVAMSLYQIKSYGHQKSDASYSIGPTGPVITHCRLIHLTRWHKDWQDEDKAFTVLPQRPTQTAYNMLTIINRDTPGE